MTSSDCHVPIRTIGSLGTLYETIVSCHPDAAPFMLVLLAVAVFSRTPLSGQLMLFNVLAFSAIPNILKFLPKDTVTVVDLRGNAVHLPLDLCENWKVIQLPFELTAPFHTFVGIS